MNAVPKLEVQALRPNHGATICVKALLLSLKAIFGLKTELDWGTWLAVLPAASEKQLEKLRFGVQPATSDPQRHIPAVPLHPLSVDDRSEQAPEILLLGKYHDTVWVLESELMQKQRSSVMVYYFHGNCRLNAEFLWLKLISGKRRINVPQHCVSLTLCLFGGCPGKESRKYRDASGSRRSPIADFQFRHVHGIASATSAMCALSYRRAAASSVTRCVLNPQNDHQNGGGEGSADASEVVHSINEAGQDHCIPETFVTPAHAAPSISARRLPNHACNLIGKAQDVFLSSPQAASAAPPPQPNAVGDDLFSRGYETVAQARSDGGAPAPAQHVAALDAHSLSLLAAQNNVIDGLKAENDRLRKMLAGCDWYWPEDDTSSDACADGPWQIAENHDVKPGEVFGYSRGGVVETRYYGFLEAANDAESDEQFEADEPTRQAAEAKIAAELQRRADLATTKGSADA